MIYFACIPFIGNTRLNFFDNDIKTSKCPHKKKKGKQTRALLARWCPVRIASTGAFWPYLQGQMGKQIPCQDDISRHIAHNEIAACIHLQTYSVPVL